MFNNDDHECMWGLKDSIWPARCLREFKDARPESISLVLVPLSRIGQMEGKSGSLVWSGTLPMPPRRIFPGRIRLL